MIAVEWIGGWLEPELLGPWGSMYVLLIGPLYVSLWPRSILAQRAWLDGHHARS